MTTEDPTMSKVSRKVAATGAALLAVRWLVRAPIWLYRARLGFVFGTRLLMLEHTGRTTGARRYVVLEILARPAPGTFVVASGFGGKAHWFRNIVANPQVRLYLGSHRPRHATARILDRGDSSAALAGYKAAHPRAWRTLRPVLETTLGAQIDDHATSLPMVALNFDDPDDHQVATAGTGATRRHRMWCGNGTGRAQTRLPNATTWCRTRGNSR